MVNSVSVFIEDKHIDR